MVAAADCANDQGLGESFQRNCDRSADYYLLKTCAHILRVLVFRMWCNTCYNNNTSKKTHFVTLFSVLSVFFISHNYLRLVLYLNLKYNKNKVKKHEAGLQCITWESDEHNYSNKLEIIFPLKMSTFHWLSNNKYHDKLMAFGLTIIRMGF